MKPQVVGGTILTLQ